MLVHEDSQVVVGMQEKEAHYFGTANEEEPKDKDDDDDDDGLMY